MLCIERPLKNYEGPEYEKVYKNVIISDGNQHCLAYLYCNKYYKVYLHA
jgi:hypothetical protein